MSKNKIGFEGGGRLESNTGADAWTNVTAAAASDDNAVAGTFVGNDETEVLSATDFGFLLPDGATLQGVELMVERKATTADLVALAGYLLHDELLVSSVTFGGKRFTTTDETETFGSPTERWNLAWLDRAGIETTGFGLAFYVSAASQPPPGTKASST